MMMIYGDGWIEVVGMGWDWVGTHTRTHMRSGLADEGQLAPSSSCFSFLLVINFFFSFVCLLFSPTDRLGGAVLGACNRTPSFLTSILCQFSKRTLFCLFLSAFACRFHSPLDVSRCAVPGLELGFICVWFDLRFVPLTL
jgi:hypothetical protein